MKRRKPNKFDHGAVEFMVWCRTAN